MATNDYRERARDGCPVCEGEGRTAYKQAREANPWVATQPCPECERVASLLKDERERCAKWLEIALRHLPQDDNFVYGKAQAVTDAMDARAFLRTIRSQL